VQLLESRRRAEREAMRPGGSQQRSVYLPPALWAWIGVEATRRRMTRSGYINWVLGHQESAARVPRRVAATSDLSPDGKPPQSLSRPVYGGSGSGGLEHFEYRYAGMLARTDSPSVAELEADGWVVTHIDPRYQTRLMRRSVV
jgi:hypothetical protein